MLPLRSTEPSAALDVATGPARQMLPRHRAVEFRRFLDDLAKAVPDLDIHLVLDNYGTHAAMIHDWLAGQPRFHLHFTPTAPTSERRHRTADPAGRDRRA